MNGARGDDWLKRRRLRLASTGGSAGQLVSGLMTIEGLRSATLLGPRTLSLCYDLHQLNLHRLLLHLAELGALPAPGRLGSLRLRLWQYLEHRQLLDRGLAEGWTRCIRRIYISRYRGRRHGRIDDRPQQWRRYLERDT